jgi:hypothetical protein
MFTILWGRQLEASCQKAARLNPKAGKAILFADLAKRWLARYRQRYIVKPTSRLRRETTINALKHYFANMRS